ncbi:hypothetical protein BpHYR1_037215 [Brachionus plicatilis]|uniref:Uncharacterized protein n=1 Tax=Brachionus plicatilis TaxID=10195 RepID=A0A3M7PLH4_BRAPC|nr:hypothetical protein BpHYR1_037215 [Brachionus plicatilis]
MPIKPIKTKRNIKKIKDQFVSKPEKGRAKNSEKRSVETTQEFKFENNNFDRSCFIDFHFNLLELLNIKRLKNLLMSIKLTHYLKGRCGGGAMQYLLGS